MGGTSDNPSTVRPRELRIALAMRGGVSLAVWIGGAVAELDLLRLGMLGEEGLETLGEDAEAKERALSYAEALRDCGYTSVKFDVMGGASAGGLNSVIYGFAQSIGTNLEWLETVWHNQGNIWGLFREGWNPSKSTGSSPKTWDAFRVPSLLSGDKFYGMILENLHEQVRHQAGTLPRTDYLTVDLSATLQSGPSLPDEEDRDVRPRAVHFRFRRTPAAAGSFNDIPGTEAARRNQDTNWIARLAYAARATSSFPGAFEPARFSSSENAPGSREAASTAPGIESPPPPREMNKVFSEIAAADQDFDVIDGGVFDNIPIGRTVQAIADAPATIETRRILIYLDPTPPRPRVLDNIGEAGRLGSPLANRFGRTALTALKLKKTNESADDDLAQIRRLRGETQMYKERRTLAMRTFTKRRRIDTRYDSFRAASDAQRVMELMTSPGQGFLRTIVDQPPITRVFSQRAANDRLPNLESTLMDQDSTSIHRDATNLVAAADLLIAAARKLQGKRGGGSIELAKLKGELYRLRTVAMHAQQSQDREAVTKVLNGPLISFEEEPGDDSGGSNPGNVFCGAATIMRPSTFGTATELAEAITASDSDTDFWSALSAHGDEEFDSDALWDVARALGRDVCAAFGLRARQWPRRRSSFQVAVANASIALGVTRNDAVPEFFTITGDEEPKDPENAFGRVIEEGEAQVAVSLLRSRVTLDANNVRAEADRPAINAQSKLAGNQLANFAGFLDASWRDHDWSWGRLDAGKALLGIIATLKPRSEDTLDAAHISLDKLGSGGGLDRAKYRLADLRLLYRYSLAVRTLLALLRALWPLTPKSSRAPDDGFAKHLPATIALMVTRPMLVLLPLFAHPALAVGVLTMALISHDATASRLTGDLLVIGLVVLASIIFLHAWRGRRFRARWLDLAAEWESVRVSAWSDKARCRLRIMGSVYFLAGLALLASVVAFVQLNPPEWLTSARVVALLALAILTSGAVFRWAWRPDRDLQASFPRAEGVLVLLAIVAVWLLQSTEVWTLGIAVALMVAVVHLGWCNWRWTLGASLTAGVATWVCDTAIPKSLGGYINKWSAQPLGEPWQSKLETIPGIPVGAVLFLVVIFGVVLLSRYIGRVFGMFLTTSIVVIATWQALVVMPWLVAIPPALFLTASAAAATTLFVPFGTAPKS